MTAQNSIVFDPPLSRSGPAGFGAGELERVIAQGFPLRARISIDAGLGAEAYRVDTDGSGAVVHGGDAAGAMYGALELAERLAAGAPWNGAAGKPRFAIRAVKINLPWESYRRHESLRIHDQACRNIRFWKDLIDHLAVSRFNRLSLWSLHPWHLMVRSTEFPESSDLSDREHAEWATLFNGIFDHAHARGMQTQVFTWNIFVSPAFARAHKVAEYSINGDFFGDGDRSELVERYNRSIITQVLREYPNLDGIGITQSERLGGFTPQERVTWIRRVVLDAINQCGRPVEINLRIPHSANTGSGGSIDADTELMGRRQLEAVRSERTVLAEIKYNWSHGHSSPKLFRAHGGALTDRLWNPLPPYRITWMVRNEDFFVLRWFSPSFIAAHLAENDKPWTGGYYIGSECMIPARILCEKPESRSGARWQFQRQRLFYTGWGRMLYGMRTVEEQQRMIDGQYGPGTGALLLPILDAAGQVPLVIATMIGPTWDHTLYSEGFLTKDGFIGLEELIKAKPLDPSWMSVGEFVAQGQGNSERQTPLQVADKVQTDVDRALSLIGKAGQCSGEMAEEVADATAWAHLGRYVADKLRAAVALRRFRAGGDSAQQAEAVAGLKRCVGHWDALIEATGRYCEHPLQHTGSIPFHWRRYRDAVVRDEAIARGEMMENVKAMQ